MGLHRGAALGALLLLAVPACRAPTTGAASHVRWLTIFDWDPQRTHSFVNLLQRTPGGNSKSTSLLANSSLIEAWQTYGTPGLLDIEDVEGGFSEGLYIRQGISKTHLNPRWKSLLGSLLDSALPWVRKGAIRGIFLVRAPRPPARPRYPWRFA